MPDRAQPDPASGLRSPVLAAVFRHELARGNTALPAENGWSKMDLVVRMKAPIDAAYAAGAADADPQARVFETHDPHNGWDCGISCGREAIVGPSLVAPGTLRNNGI